MSICTISAGRQEVCKDSVGGLQGVYFINFESGSFSKTDASDSAVPAGLINSFSGSTVYYYELKGTSAYTETVNSSRENGTTFFSQETTLNLKKLTNEMTTQLKLLAYGRPQIIIEDNNGSLFLMGEEFGSEMNASTSTVYVRSIHQYNCITSRSSVYLKCLLCGPAHFLPWIP